MAKAGFGLLVRGSRTAECAWACVCDILNQDSVLAASSGLCPQITLRGVGEMKQLTGPANSVNRQLQH